jgi:hypothetical protein
MRWLIAEELRNCAEINQVTRILMLGLTEWPTERRCFDLGEASANGRMRTGAVRGLFSIQDFDIDKVAGRLAAHMFYDQQEGPVELVYGRDLAALCEFALEIDLAAAWNDHQAGPLSEPYWRLHTKEQLVELAGELKAGFDDKTLRGSKEQIVQAFLDRIPKDEDKEGGLPLPKEVKKLKFHA